MTSPKSNARESNMRRFTIGILAAAAAAALAACSSAPGAGTGGVRVRVATPAEKVSDVTRVVLTVSGGTLPGPQSYELTQQTTPSQWALLVTTLPAGQLLTFRADAYGAGPSPLYTGTTTATPIANTTISIVLYLNEIAPTPFSNDAPVITALLASADTVAPGASVNLRVDASDPDPGDTLSYLWTADGGSFTSAVNAALATWQAPMVAVDTVFTITIRVSDDRGGTTIGTFAITVSPGAVVGDAVVVAIVNDAPRVVAMTVVPRTSASTVFDLAATATDTESPDAALTYAWAIVDTPPSLDVYPATTTPACAGTIDTTSGTAVVFTAAPGDVGGPCTLRVTVADPDGGTNTGTVSFFVGAPAPQFPESGPVFLAAGYVPNALPRIGTTVSWWVRFTTSPPASVTWTTSWGMTPVTHEYLTGPAEIQDELAIAMPAACPTPPAAPVTISATATDPLIPASSTYQFVVSLADADGFPCP
jgi:hypothetical protein